MSRLGLNGWGRSVVGSPFNRGPVALDDGLESWDRVKIYELMNYWAAMERGQVPQPWEYPPRLQTDADALPPINALLLLTDKGRVYRLPTHREFFRIMLRDEKLKLVFEKGGREEIIIEAYRPRGGHQVKAQTITVNEPTPLRSNILPFKPKRP